MATKKKFSSLLLTGKAATLPLLIQQSHAAYTPTTTDIFTTTVSQIELAVSNQVVLDSMGSAYGSSMTYGAATLCSDSSVASSLGLVITGLSDGDEVFVVTATSLGGNETLHANVKIGSQDLKVPAYFKVGASGTVSGMKTAVSVPIDLTALGYTLTSGKQFYLQTIVFPAGAVTSAGMSWSGAKISELDTVSVKACSTYGGTGSTY